MKIVIAVKRESKVFNSVVINEVKEVEYTNVEGFTFEEHDENETGTGKTEQCVVIWFNDSTERATFVLSEVAYIKEEK